jgi:hypothetical protein
VRSQEIPKKTALSVLKHNQRIQISNLTAYTIERMRFEVHIMICSGLGAFMALTNGGKVVLRMFILASTASLLGLPKFYLPSTAPGCLL